MEIKEIDINKIIPYENNPRNNDDAVDKVAESIKQFGFQQPIVVDKDMVVIVGHTRLKASHKLGLEVVPVVIADELSEEQVKAYRLADNKTGEFATWDFELLDFELDEIQDIDMAEFGFDKMKEEDTESVEEHTKLTEKFIVPPFSILDARQGYWQDRKKMWKERCQDNAEARKNAEVIATSFDKEKYGIEMKNNVSILDPVLSEIICKWFLPKENSNKCFDVFAGDTVFGYVRSYLGNEFTGIELRQEQTDFNNERVKKLNAKYVCDDGRNVLNYIEKESQDLLFSCPPYYDLEIYSDKENDASNQETYEEFYAILDKAFSNAIKCLKNERFAVIVCGDIRNKKTGFYYNFAEDIKETFKNNGMFLYNEAILIDPVGTAMLRANRTFRTRKLVKVHQNVLVFYKGNTKAIKENFKELEVEYESENLEF